MNKSRPKSTSFTPNPNNIGGRAQITQQMYNHYNRLYSVKSTIKADVRPQKKADLRPKSTQVIAQPLSAEALYQKAKLEERKSVALQNGISVNQWKTINSFSIVGQSNRKKANFNTAIDHYFNLRAMYKKINHEKFRPTKEKTVLMFKKTPSANMRPATNMAHAFVSDTKRHEEPVQAKTAMTKKSKAKSQNKTASKPKVSVKKQKVKKEKIGTFNQLDDKRIYERTEEDDDTENDMYLQNTQEQALINENMNKLNEDDDDMEDDFDDMNGEDGDGDSNSEAKAFIELQSKIPSIDKNSSPQAIDEFKQVIVELIFEYEIFNEEDFEKFFELCCMKCRKFDVKDMELLFDEVKLYLYEQLKGDIEDEAE